MLSGYGVKNRLGEKCAWTEFHLELFSCKYTGSNPAVSPQNQQWFEGDLVAERAQILAWCKDRDPTVFVQLSSELWAGLGAVFPVDTEWLHARV